MPPTKTSADYSLLSERAIMHKKDFYSWYLSVFYWQFKTLDTIKSKFNLKHMKPRRDLSTFKNPEIMGA